MSEYLTVRTLTFPFNIMFTFPGTTASETPEPDLEIIRLCSSILLYTTVNAVVSHSGQFRTRLCGEIAFARFSDTRIRHMLSHGLGLFLCVCVGGVWATHSLAMRSSRSFLRRAMRAEMSSSSPPLVAAAALKTKQNKSRPSPRPSHRNFLTVRRL